MVNFFVKTSDAIGIFYAVNHTLTNNVAAQTMDDVSVKLFYADGTNESQYGLFGALTSCQSITRTYTCTQYTATEITALEFNSSADDDMGLNG